MATYNQYMGVDGALSSLAYAIIDESKAIIKLGIVTLPKGKAKATDRLDEHCVSAEAHLDAIEALCGSAAIKAAIETTVAFSGPNATTMSQGAFCSGYWAGRLSRLCDVTLIAPVKWKGTKKKEVTVQNVKKQLGKEATKDLDTYLKTIPKPRHADVYDALGIALWRLENG